MEMSFLLLIALTAINISLLIYAFARHFSVQNNSTLSWKPAPVKSNFIVAIICDKHSPSVDVIIEALEARLAPVHRNNYLIDVFEGMSKSRRIETHVSTLTTHNNLCIVTTDLYSTQIAQKHLIANKSSTPLLYCNIHESEAHIVQQPPKSIQCSGVLTRLLTKDFCSLFFELKPNIQNCVLVPSKIRSQYHDKQYEDTLSILSQKGINVQILRTYEEIKEQSDIDGIIALDHSFSHEEIKKIAGVARKRKITLCTTDWDALSHGAAISINGDKSIIGKRIAHKIRLIAEDNIPVEQLSVDTVSLPPIIRFNRSQVTEQNIPITEQTLSLINASEGLDYILEPKQYKRIPRG